MKGIIFTEEMFNAVIEGRKTQTRRIMQDGVPIGNWEETVKYARYKVGEVVYLKEKFRIGDFRLSSNGHYGISYKDGTKKETYFFYNEIDKIKKSQKSSMDGFASSYLMREYFCRYYIEITDVRVERLQDISDEDCLKEGIFKREKWSLGTYYQYKWNGEVFQTAQEAYAALINKTYGKGTWESNPYVWVYEFELVNNR